MECRRLIVDVEYPAVCSFLGSRLSSVDLLHKCVRGVARLSSRRWCFPVNVVCVGFAPWRIRGWRMAPCAAALIVYGLMAGIIRRDRVYTYARRCCTRCEIPNTLAAVHA